MNWLSEDIQLGVNCDEKARAERAVRMRDAALNLQDLYAPGNEHSEITELNTDDILEDTSVQAIGGIEK